MAPITLRFFAAAAASTLLLSMGSEAEAASAFPRKANPPQVQNQQVQNQQVQNQTQTQNYFDLQLAGTVPAVRPLACYTSEFYNVYGAKCQSKCNSPYTTVCQDQCCGSALSKCTDQCLYIAAKPGVKGSLPACTNGCVGNAVMNLCEENCDTNGANINLPACTNNCATAGTAPLCDKQCYTYPAKKKN